jgi:hypothetical protein
MAQWRTVIPGSCPIRGLPAGIPTRRVLNATRIDNHGLHDNRYSSFSHPNRAFKTVAARAWPARPRRPPDVINGVSASRCGQAAFPELRACRLVFGTTLSLSDYRGLALAGVATIGSVNAAIPLLDLMRIPADINLFLATGIVNSRFGADISYVYGCDALTGPALRETRLHLRILYYGLVTVGLTAATVVFGVACGPRVPEGTTRTS